MSIIFRNFLETDLSQTTERVHWDDLISARTFARDDQKNDEETWMKKIREFYSRLQDYVRHRDDFQWYQSSSESNQVDLKWRYYDERFNEWNAVQKRSTISDKNVSSSFDHFECEHRRERINQDHECDVCQFSEDYSREWWIFFKSNVEHDQCRWEHAV